MSLRDCFFNSFLATERTETYEKPLRKSLRTPLAPPATMVPEAELSGRAGVCSQWLRLFFVPALDFKKRSLR